MNLQNAGQLFSYGVGLGVVLCFYPEMIVFAVHKVLGIFKQIG